MSNKQHIENSKSIGFTLLESIVALYVLTVGVVGALTLTQQGLAQSIVFRNQLIATGLAQEGAELIHNKRLSNIRTSRKEGCQTPCDAELDTLDEMGEMVADCEQNTGNTGCWIAWGSPIKSVGAATPFFELERCGLEACPLIHKNSEGYYSYNTDDPETIFRRTIILKAHNQSSPINDLTDRPEWEVISRVEWESRFGHEEIEVRTFLSPWL